MNSVARKMRVERTGIFGGCCMHLSIWLTCLACLAHEVPAAPSPAALKAAADYNASHRGQALVVLHDGQVIYERYDHGGAPDRLQMLASGSKSFIGVAAVAAVQDGILRLDDPACEAITECKGDPNKAKITYRHLLTMTSGLQPGERGKANQIPSWKEIIARPTTGKPGEQFQYGPYHLLAFAYALERKLGKESLEAYLQRRIFEPLDIKVEWRIRCADGHPQVGGGAFPTARDWTRFGEFIRQQGRWGENSLSKPS